MIKKTLIQFFADEHISPVKTPEEQTQQKNEIEIQEEENNDDPKQD